MIACSKPFLAMYLRRLGANSGKGETTDEECVKYWFVVRVNNASASVSCETDRDYPAIQWLHRKRYFAGQCFLGESAQSLANSVCESPRTKLSGLVGDLENLINSAKGNKD